MKNWIRQDSTLGWLPFPAESPSYSLPLLFCFKRKMQWQCNSEIALCEKSLWSNFPLIFVCLLIFITNVEMHYYYYFPQQIFSQGFHQLRSLIAGTGIRGLILILSPTLPKLWLLILISSLCSPTPSSVKQVEDQHRLKRTRFSNCWNWPWKKSGQLSPSVITPCLSSLILEWRNLSETTKFSSFSLFYGPLSRVIWHIPGKTKFCFVFITSLHSI